METRDFGQQTTAVYTDHKSSSRQKKISPKLLIFKQMTISINRFGYQIERSTLSTLQSYGAVKTLDGSQVTVTF